MSDLDGKKRQLAWWRLVGAAFGSESTPALETMVRELAEQEGLPPPVLDAALGIDQLVRRHPELKADFDTLGQWVTAPAAGSDTAPVPPDTAASLRQTLLYSKLLLNVFGPNTRTQTCSATQYAQWLSDSRALQQCLGMMPGSPGRGWAPSGQAPVIDAARLREELVAMESDLVHRMDLREVLSDDRLAAQLTPSMALVEQLLRDKSNLPKAALDNARSIIRKYIDELATVLKQQVVSTRAGQVDRSVPPRKVFRNLDLKRTLWKNLPNWDSQDERLYVQQLFYRHTSQKQLNKHLIVVVDQSGSMVAAMVQCAILASIFAALPRIQVSMLAFDTHVIDLTPWVADPLESLLRTNLGGGNDGPKAMEVARTLIADARRTTMVWISDFYEDRRLLPMIKSVKESGVRFIPVGSVSGTGYFSLDPWFRDHLKQLGLPVLTGNIKNLITELKKQLT